MLPPNLQVRPRFVTKFHYLAMSFGGMEPNRHRVTFRSMTKELTGYISEIRSDLQSKIKMLEPAPGMSALEVRRARILAAECERLDAVIEQFSLLNTSRVGDSHKATARLRAITG